MAGLYDGLEQVAPTPAAAPPPPKTPSMYDGLEVVPDVTSTEPQRAAGVVESFQAGLQASSTGLAWRRKLPDLITAEHEDFWQGLARSAGGLAGDIGPMIAGAVVGAPAGAAVGAAVTGPAAPVGAVAGGLIGAGAGMGLVPAALRESLTAAYRSGEVTTKAEWWAELRAAAQRVLTETAVSGATFGAVGAAGRVTGRVVAPLIGEMLAVPTQKAGAKAVEAGLASTALSSAELAAAIVAFPTIPALLDARLPDLTEIGHSAIILGGLKGAHLAAERVANVFAKTGKTPAEQVADAQADPKVAAELGAPKIIGRPEGGFGHQTTDMTPGAAMPSIQEAFFKDVARLNELEAPAKADTLTAAEKTELSDLRVRVADLEGQVKTAKVYDASAQRVYDSVLAQVREADQARVTAGLSPLGDEHAQAVAALVRARARTRAERLGVLPEEIYNERPLQIQDVTAKEIATAEAAIPTGAPTFTPPVDLFGITAPPVPRYGIEGVKTEEVPLANLTLSKEVPQFKAAADEMGVIVPLGGKFDRIGVGPIQVWERTDGRMEVISGRHRLDLARRSGETTIPAQVHKESEGFTVRQAATLDAQLNIREEQGSVADYAQYFKDAGITQEAATELGLLARAKGRAGFAIARDAGPDLLAAHRAGLLSDEAALSISSAAPRIDRLQALGMELVNNGKSILMAVNTMKAVDLMAAERKAAGAQGDIFGFDDSAMREASAMAKLASTQQRQISEQISAVSGASKRPELARKMGVDVQDPEGIQKKVLELRQEQVLWDNWPLHPELVARLRGVTGREGELKQAPVEDFVLQAETPEELRKRNEEAAAQVARSAAEEAAGRKPGKALTPEERKAQADLFSAQGTLFQGPAERWYSELGRQIDAAKMNQAPAQGWKDYLRGLKGVKADEIKWSGIDEWLDLQKGKVTKEQVAEYLRGNGVHINEVLRGDMGGELERLERSSRTMEQVVNTARTAAFGPQWGDNISPLDRANANLWAWGAAEGNAADVAKLNRLAIQQAQKDAILEYGRRALESRDLNDQLLTARQGTTTKFGTYQLPGGENYRELLLTLPGETMPRGYHVEERADGFHVINENGSDLGRWPTYAAAEGSQARHPESPVFHGGHWDEPNVLAHVRFNERIDAEGKRVLFVEEIQSDWAQKGKKEGFGERNTRIREITERYLPGQDWNQTSVARLREAGAPQEVQTEFFNLLHTQGGAPSAPFIGKTEAWVGLTLKRMIAYAAENGFDKIAWTTGEQQVERYTNALRTAVDEIEWKKTSEGVQLVGYKGERAGNLTASEVTLLNQLRALRDSGESMTRSSREHLAELESKTERNKIVDTTQKEDLLSDAIGKAMADRIIKDPNQTGTISGKDLKIDDTGMAGFYDRIVPNVANDVLKKLGGERVTETYLSPTGEAKTLAADNAASAGAIGAAPQPSFDITPAMVEKARAGLPLFQQHRGSYQVAENLITIMQGADKSTVLHELGHSWLEEMKADAARPGAPEGIKSDWDLLRRELAIPESGDIARASHEQWARSVERYLAEGEAPSAELRSVFQRFKEWLLEIYKSISAFGVKINPELKGALDRILATDEEIAAARDLGVPRAYVTEAKTSEARKIVPGFKAEQVSLEPYADELPKGPGQAPDDSHVNYAYINTPTDVKLTMQKMAEIDQAWIQKQRGGVQGVKSWADANAEQAKYVNDILGGTEDTLRLLSPRDPEAPGPDVKLGILKKLAVGAAKDSARLRDVVLERGHDATVREQLDYMGSIERARMIQAEFLGERAGVARALNALKDVTEGSGEIARMLDAIGYGDRPNELYQAARTAAEEQAYLKAKLDEILLRYRGKTVLEIAALHKEIGSLKGSYEFARRLEKASTWEMVVEGWRSGLLSGPVTHTTNLFGTGAFQVLRTPVDALASLIGMARGASPGLGESDRASMSEAVAGLTAYLGSVQDGLKVGYHTFLADQTTGKTESYREAIPGPAGPIIRIPLRLMGAEDAAVNTMYTRKAIIQLAIRTAFDEDLNPSTREFAERVDFLKDHPTAEMQVAADKEAARMTFNAPYGEKGAALQRWVNTWKLQWMIPFIRTPLNITAELGRMSPFAPLVADWRADFARGGAARDQALAEFALGSGIMALTMAYAFAGNISGAGSPDAGKNRGKAGVWQPYSVLIGDTWHEYGRIQPTGTLMGIAADLANVWDHLTPEEMDKTPKMLAVAFSNAVTNQTFLQGITNFVNATSDPTRFGAHFLQQFAGSMVPNVVGQPTAMADPVVREVNTMMEAIQARIPGFRQDLLPKLDWLGEPVQTKERLGAVLPVREQKVSEDKVRLEASRLDISMAAAPKKTHIGKGTGKLGDIEFTPEERNKFQEVGGQLAHKILTNIVNGESYDALPDLVKKQIFSKVLTASHRVAAVAALPMEKRIAYIQQISEKVAAELAPAGEQ